MKPKSNEPEFTHFVAVDKIPALGLDIALEANEAQRHALAKRFDLVDVPKLAAQLHVSQARAGEAFSVSGTMIADIIQTCVVTLEPLPAHIERDISVLFVFEEALNVGDQVIQAEMDTEDIEPIAGGRIDLGELVSQHLGISLDPYPRKAGVSFGNAEFGDTKASSNPFSRLTELKKKPK